MGQLKSSLKTFFAPARRHESSPADLNDPPTMPPALFKVHRKPDKTVLKHHGPPDSAGERGIVAKLFKLYQKKTAN